jgi:hypothetical protein
MGQARWLSGLSLEQERGLHPPDFMSKTIAVAKDHERPSAPLLDEAAVAELAYRRWVEKGCPQGSAENDWFEAERELRAGGAPQPADR